METKEITVNKLCVFCGNRPTNKNKEHIIPKWLLKFTGDPNRKANFGYDIPNLSKSKELKPRIYAFSHFQFPACTECNTLFASLEEKAKNIVEDIFNGNNLDTEEITTLLDWFDKVRTGLWLAFNSLDNHYKYITPKFHITKRIAIKDRLLIVYNIPESKKGLSFAGVNSPVFQSMPSAFVMRINNKIFLNASTDYLVSRNIGFSYGTVHDYEKPSLNPIFNIHRGTDKIEYPIVKFSYPKGGTEIYQAISGNRSMIIGEPKVQNDYTSERSYSKEKDLSKIFFKEDNEISILEEDEFLNIDPEVTLKSDRFDILMNQMAMLSQLQIFEQYNNKMNKHKDLNKHYKLLVELQNKLISI